MNGKNMRKGIVLAMALCLSLFITQETAAEENTSGTLITSGSCGTSATYTVYDSDEDQIADTLVIGGSGSTNDYSIYMDDVIGKQADTPYKEYVSVITKVVIKKEVTVLGDRLCYKMTNLEEVVFEEESCLTTIGQGAFYGCEKLKKIELPKSVVTLGMESFASCAGLKEVVFLSDETLTSLGGYCFSNCTSLKEMTLPDSITTIGSNAFQMCENLESIKLPMNLTGELKATFLKCKKLQSIQIPDGVTGLGTNAFNSCYALKEVIFSENTQCTTIGDYVFSDCDALEFLIIPKTVTAIGKRVLERCDGLKIVIIETAQLTAESVGQDFIAVSEVGTIVYPEKYLENNSEILKKIFSSTIQTQLATTEEDDGTISVKVIAVADGATKIECPELIAGKEVGTITYADGIDGEGIMIGCHVTAWQMDASGHWQEESVCRLCRKTLESVEKTAHTYIEGEITCACGFVKPISITKHPSSQTLRYGYSSYYLLSGACEKNVDATVSYYWTENGEVVSEGSNEYKFVARKDAGEYTIIFHAQTQKYEINGESVQGEAYKFLAQSEAAVVTVKKRPITVQICAAGRYEGDENPQFSVEVVSGSLAYDDTANDLALNFYTTATRASACGEYEITGTSESGNYEVTILPGVLTVKEKPADTSGNGESGDDGTSEEDDRTQALPKKGDRVLTSTAVYKVVKPGDLSGKIGTVTYVKPRKKTVKKVTIPSTVTIGGIKYKVTAIGANAFKKCTKLKKVTIGTNVSKIGKKAFYNCKKLKTIVIKTKKLTAKKVGAQAFKNTHKKATIKVPKNKYKAYKKWLKKKGVGKKIKIKKI